jgi:ATP synthase protein I
MSADDQHSGKPTSGPVDQPARPGTISQADRDAFRKRADELGAKLGTVRGEASTRQTRTEGSAEDNAARSSALGQAFRISVDLIAGVAVGGLIGYLLDRQFPAARPWFLVAFLFVGFAAGMLNVIRTARAMQKQAEPMQRRGKSVKDEPDET